MTAAKRTSPSSSARRSSEPRSSGQLTQLVLKIGERTVDVRILEADRLRALLELARVQQGRQRLGHVMEDAFAPLLLALDAIPVLLHAPRRLGLDVAEDVRVAPDELLVDQPRRLREVALALLLEQKREEVDLEQQVTELVEQLVVVAGERRIGDLVRLLDRVRHDRARRLLAVPRAVAAQPLRQQLQVEKGLLEALHAIGLPWTPSAAEAVPVDAVLSGT